MLTGLTASANQGLQGWFLDYFEHTIKIGLTGPNSWLQAIQDTLYMTAVAFVVGGAIGLVIGLFLVLTGPNGVLQNRLVFRILDLFTSIFRAIPFIIMLALLKGLTMLIMGTTIGLQAALVPLVGSTFPFFARQVQVVLSEMDGGVIEAAQASGATTFDIIKVYLSEGLPDLIRVSTVTLISLIGETAMAGAIGAGGLGNIAVVKGYNQSHYDVTIVATVLVVLIVFSLQLIGDFLTKRISHK